MELSQFGDYKIKLHQVDSTNNYAVSLFSLGRPVEGTIVIADFQERGKGQFNSSWESEIGKNLLASFILYPAIDVSDFFYLNQCISLSVFETVASFIPSRKVKIKWPNDILVEEKKAAGILIENNIKGNQFSHSIAGIGININQQSFSEYTPRATSLVNEAGNAISVDEVLKKLCRSLDKWYGQLQNESFRIIRSHYLDAMFGLNEKRKFLYQSKIIEATIKNVQEDGKLVIEENGSRHLINFKEIKFMFNNT